MKRQRTDWMKFGALCALALAVSFSHVPASAQRFPLGEAAPVFSLPAMDNLAARLATEISHHKLKSVVVAGILGNETRVTELGAQTLDGLTASLARQSHGTEVTDSAALRAFLQQNRISQDMVYSDSLAEWIAGHLKADGIVTTHLDTPSAGAVDFGVQLGVLHKGVYEKDPWIKVRLPLTESQTESADRDFVEISAIPAIKFGAVGFIAPECISCPHPAYPPRARQLNIIGAPKLMFTVRQDGVPDEIFVAQPAGYGMDAQAVDAVLAWKFKPATDPQGHPVAMRTLVDVTFLDH